MAVLLFCPCNTVHHLLFHYTVSIRGITIKAFNCFVGLHVGFVLSFLANWVLRLYPLVGPEREDSAFKLLSKTHNWFESDFCVVLGLSQNIWDFFYQKSFQNTEICAAALRAFAYFEPVVGPLHNESQYRQPPERILRGNEVWVCFVLWQLDQL